MSIMFLNQKKQKGVGIITALFLISGMLVIGLSFVLFMTQQKTNSSLDILQTKAYFAAKSGVDIAAYNSIVLNNCLNSTVDLGSSLYVNIQCVRTTKQEAGQPVIIDQIISTGCFNNSNTNCPSTDKTGLYTEKQIVTYINP